MGIMPRCPRCGERIDHLIYIQQAAVRFKGQYGRNGYSMVFEDNRVIEREAYHCPVCGALLAENEKEAIKILRERNEVPYVLRYNEGSILPFCNRRYTCVYMPKMWLSGEAPLPQGEVPFQILEDMRVREGSPAG